jgi:DUF971 family protein
VETKPAPTNITASRKERTVILTWKDGHTSIYPFGLLRAACPCASCRGGHENMRPEPDPEVFDEVLPDSPETRLVKIEAVGSYAMVIDWEDGHHYGIYNWHFLRALCPCEECREVGSVRS